LIDTTGLPGFRRKSINLFIRRTSESGNILLIFTLLFLIAFCGCQKADKQTVEQNYQTKRSSLAKNGTIEEKEDDIYIPGDAKE